MRLILQTCHIWWSLNPLPEYPCCHVGEHSWQSHSLPPALSKTLPDLMTCKTKQNKCIRTRITGFIIMVHIFCPVLQTDRRAKGVNVANPEGRQKSSLPGWSPCSFMWQNIFEIFPFTLRLLFTCRPEPRFFVVTQKQETNIKKFMMFL